MKFTEGKVEDRADPPENASLRLFFHVAGCLPCLDSSCFCDAEGGSAGLSPVVLHQQVQTSQQPSAHLLSQLQTDLQASCGLKCSGRKLARSLKFFDFTLLHFPQNSPSHRIRQLFCPSLPHYDYHMGIWALFHFDKNVAVSKMSWGETGNVRRNDKKPPPFGLSQSAKQYWRRIAPKSSRYEWLLKFI